MNANHVNARLWSWLQQLLLRRRPQDDALSYRALAGGMVAYLLVDLLQASSSWPVFEAIAASLVDVLVMILFTALVLAVTRKSPRLVQTLTALAGTGALLGVISMPLFLPLLAQGAETQPAPVLVAAWLLVFVWHIVVQAHIYRHALTTGMVTGLGVALAQAVLIMVLLERLFPRVAESGGLG